MSTPPSRDGAGGRGAPAAAQVPAWRLFGTLAVAGAAAGLLIVLAFGWAQPRIRAHQAEVLRAAIEEVLGAPDHYQTLYVAGGALVPDLPAGADSVTAERVYLGFDAQDRPVGFAVPGAEPGFQDVISLIFGYDPVKDQLTGMKVLDSKETPGLGDRITSDTTFLAGFRGVVPLLVGVKRGAGSGDAHQLDMITGATISSRAVIAIINHRLEKLQPLLQAYVRQKGTAR